jgi:uncharacterized protein YdhG (YjbR/CyaY superfamily)
LRKKYSDVDGYIADFPENIRKILDELRRVIRKAAPGARETISYGMPAYKLKGNLVYFAAYKGHIGFYPTSSGIEAFKNELSSYVTSKGAVRFPLDRPIPFALVEKIVKFRVNEITKKVL